MDKVKGGYVEGAASIIINLILFALKFWAGVVTGSLALTADAWHTLSDSISSVVLVVTAKLMSKKADKEHPFGHGRWEQVAALFISFILGIIGYDFLKQSIVQFRNREAVFFGTIAIVVTAVSIVVKEALAQYAFYIARKTGNTSVKADGWHHRSDALSSVVVLIGMFLAKYFWWIDSAMAAIIALFLFYATFKIIKETVTKMLGEEPGEDLIEKITADVKAAYHDNLQIHHFHLHDYVTERELTLHIRLDKDMTIEKGHQIASEIEETIEKNFGIIATIHIEPLKTAAPT
ncbi:MAG: cation diffusion facilitator family transporter [Treponema sp.]|jgi:cation diffusion facilitator family transporter|nr:cation diffusion facilitator family transporter [Treponema sp.]